MNMEYFIQFLINNWYLCLALIIILVLLIRYESGTTVAGTPFLSPQEIIAKINHAHAVIVDIRSISAYDKGHILGAIHLVQSDVKDKIKKLYKYRSKPLVVVCENGHQSSRVMPILRKEGFETLFGLKGGIHAWREAGLPLTKS